MPLQAERAEQRAEEGFVRPPNFLIPRDEVVAELEANLLDTPISKMKTRGEVDYALRMLKQAYPNKTIFVPKRGGGKKKVRMPNESPAYRVLHEDLMIARGRFSPSSTAIITPPRRR